MSKKQTELKKETTARFVVDSEGRATDKESPAERAARFWRQMNERALWDWQHKNWENFAKFGGCVLFPLGLMSFYEASNSPGIFGFEIWVLLGSLLVIVGLLLFIYAVRLGP